MGREGPGFASANLQDLREAKPGGFPNLHRANGRGGFGSQTAADPKSLLRLFFRNNLARLKITSEAINNLKRLF